jgi:predicted DsbA family dithiol-disulfide isomerase
MRIDIISDTVCPWCYVGKRKLERALELFLEQNPKVPVEIEWRPFQLDPTTPKEGVDRREHIKRKFGEGPQIKAVGERIAQMGAEEGIAFAFDKIERSPNTLDSHRLIHWSGGAGCQDTVVTALFKAYFEEGRDIGDRQVLVDVAQKAGMDGDLVKELLERDADLE